MPYRYIVIENQNLEKYGSVPISILGAPFELPNIEEEEVQLISLLFLVGIFLTLVVYIGFYVCIYKQANCSVRCIEKINEPVVRYNGKTNDPGDRHHWFKPFCFLNGASNDMSSEWLGDWTSVCS